MTGNKKIRGASWTEYKGIKFRSKLEERFFKVCENHGLNVIHEPKKMTLMEKFEPKKVNFHSSMYKIVNVVRAITYMPDFVYMTKTQLHIIECKGFANDVYPVKRKLILQYLEQLKTDLEIHFWEIKTVKDIKEFIKHTKNE